MRNIFSLRSLIGAALMALLPSSGDAFMKPLTDSQILGIYIQVNAFDIETALLGRSQAKSDGIRKLAAHVASDHLGVRQAAYALAKECKTSVALPGERDADAMEHGKVMAQLSLLNGESFDSAYADHEAAFHRAAIEAVRTLLLPAASCPALKTHLTKVLPAFEHHLAETEAIRRGMSHP